MRNRAVVALGEIAEQIRGVTYSKGEASLFPLSQHVPILRAGNITEWGLQFDDLIYVPTRRVRERQMLREGDIVVAASSGSLDVVGKAEQLDRPFSGSFGAFCKVVRPSRTVDPRYLGHYFRTPHYRRTISSLAAGANINNLKSEHLDELQIPLPPLGEQQRIAAILDQADALRAKRREAIAHLDTITMATFLSMFGGLAFGYQRLGTALDSAEVFTDGDWVESKDQDPNGEVRLTQLADVGDGSWLDKSARFLTARKAAELRCTYLAAGDVLVARMPDPLGRACVFPGDRRPAVTVVDVCVIRVDRERATPEWLAACINTPNVRAQIARFATGTTRSRISRGNLKEVLIPDVPISAQAVFSERARVFNLARSSSRRQLVQLDSLFASLQGRAFKGEL